MASQLGSLKAGSGISSGLPIDDLVQQTVEQQFKHKRETIDTTEVNTQSKITSLGKVKSALSDLEDSLKKINSTSKLLSKVGNVYNDSSVSDTKKYVDATVSNTASAGSYSLEVISMAKADKYKSNVVFTSLDQIIGTGDLLITIGGDDPNNPTKELSINIDEDNKTLAGVKSKINSMTDSTGISATIISAQNELYLVLNSQEAGLKNGFTITVENDGDGDSGDGAGLSQLATANMTNSIPAANGTLEIDGIEIPLESNNVNNVIDGVSLKITGEDVGKVHTLVIEEDSNQIKEKITDFVENYNKVIDIISELTRYKKDSNSIYDSDNKADDGDDLKDLLNEVLGKKKQDSSVDFKSGHGIFLGDPTVRRLSSSLSSGILTTVTNSWSSYDPTRESEVPQSLFNLGIKSDYKTGKLEIDEDKLDAMIKHDSASVANIIGNEEYGVSASLVKSLDSFGGHSGLFATQMQSEINSLSDIMMERGRIEEKAMQLEYDMTMQFVNLEKILADSQTQQNSIQQGLMSLM